MSQWNRRSRQVLISRGSSHRRNRVKPAAFRVAHPSANPRHVACAGMDGACRCSAQSSARVSLTRTGRRVFHAPNAAMAAHGFACTSLPPKAPPMRKHSTVTLLRVISQDARDHFLSFGGMLRGGMRQDAAIFVQPGDRALGFQIEMFLSADLQFALKMQRAGLDSTRRRPGQSSAERNENCPQVSVLDARIAGSGVVCDSHAAGPALRSINNFARTHATGWLWYITSVGNSGSSWRFDPESPRQVHLAR